MSLSHLSPDFDRSTGIGASEVGMALGLSPYVSPYALWARKRGLVEDQEQTARMEWGLRLQDPILEAYADRMSLAFGTQVRRNRVTKAWAWWPHLFATPDGFVLEPDPEGLHRAWLIEAKAPQSSDGWGPDGSAEVPPDYYAQVQAQMMVYDMPRCDLAALFHGSDFRVYPIMADPASQDSIGAALRAWWEAYMEGDQEPPITKASRSNDVALGRFQGDAGDMMATPELEGLMVSLVLAWQNRKQAQDGFDLVRQRMEQAMGEHSSLATAQGSVTWKRSPDSQDTDWRLLAASLEAGLTLTMDWLKARGITAAELAHVGIPSDLDALRSLYTTTKRGQRRFLVTPPKDR